MTELVKLSKKGKKDLEGCDLLDILILNTIEQMEIERAEMLHIPRSKVWIDEDQVVERLLTDQTMR